MPYYERKCLSCGQTVIKGDTICRSCGARLQDNCQYIEKEEDTINGVPISDMSLFIDKNSSRYIDIFAKNRDKKIFFNMNWAAMFFNVYWMFYRKMYKYAIVFLIVSFLFTLGLTTAVSAHFRPQIAAADKIIAPYTEYIEGTSGFYGSYFDGTVSYEEIMYAKSEYNKEINSITAKMGFWLIMPSLIFGAVFGMLADCIYRRFVMKKCRYTEGGTSIWSMIVGIVVYQVATNLIISPIITDVAFKILR